jgi:hypothetical protein
MAVMAALTISKRAGVAGGEQVFELPGGAEFLHGFAHGRRFAQHEDTEGAGRFVAIEHDARRRAGDARREEAVAEERVVGPDRPAVDFRRKKEGGGNAVAGQAQGQFGAGHQEEGRQDREQQAVNPLHARG